MPKNVLNVLRQISCEDWTASLTTDSAFDEVHVSLVDHEPNTEIQGILRDLEHLRLGHQQSCGIVRIAEKGHVHALERKSHLERIDPEPGALRQLQPNDLGARRSPPQPHIRRRSAPGSGPCAA